LELAFHGQAPFRMTQGGQDSDRQWGFTQPHPEEDIYQDGLNITDLTPLHDTFHDLIPGQSSTSIGRIDLEVICVSGDNKSNEMLTFKVTSFDIGYNCILRRTFLKYMVVIHTAYAILKMPSLNGVITIKADQRDALACKNASLSHVGCFGDKEAQERAA
jgi:hypothetical protein